MKSYILLFIKGFVIGIANLIPGVSGGTLAITLGIYERLIEILSNFKSNVKENVKFLIPIFLGVGASILSLSGLISLCLERFLFPTIMLFVGAILGGLPMLCKKLKVSKLSFSKAASFLGAFFVVVLATVLGSGNAVSFGKIGVLELIKLFFVGGLTSATMVVPGVSGSALLMTLGYYKPIIDTVKSLTDFSILGHNLAIVLPLDLE